jgi:sulfur relay (sulfurtransferase) DsrF/TusC family protein
VPHHLLIESQGQWAGPNACRFLRDAIAIAESGQQVSVFLAQDGVFAAVPDASPEVARLAELGVPVLADEFSIAARALTAGKLSPYVTVTAMDTVAKLLLADGCRAVWH